MDHLTARLGTLGPVLWLMLLFTTLWAQQHPQVDPGQLIPRWFHQQWVRQCTKSCKKKQAHAPPSTIAQALPRLVDMGLR